MRRIARLVKKLAALALLAALLLAPIASGAEEYPAFLTEVRKAMVNASAPGVLASPHRVLAIHHGSVLSPGDAVGVAFFGLWNVLEPEQSRSRSIVPEEFVRRGKVLCSFKDLDVEWIELLEPLPEGVKPVALSKRITPRLYVLPIPRGVPPLVRATFTGAYYQGFPVLQLLGATSFPGWSGSPVVNDRGEVVGLHRSGFHVGTGELNRTTMAVPLKTCNP